MSVLSRLLGRDADDELLIEPCDVAILPTSGSSGCRIEAMVAQRVPRDLELARAGDRFYVVARSAVASGTGLMFVVGDACHQHRGLGGSARTASPRDCWPLS
jgi:hypothetical protein